MKIVPPWLKKTHRQTYCRQHRLLTIATKRRRFYFCLQVFDIFDIFEFISIRRGKIHIQSKHLGKRIEPPHWPRFLHHPSADIKLDERLVTLIDTPEFDDSDKSDVGELKMIAEFLVEPNCSQSIDRRDLHTPNFVSLGLQNKISRCSCGEDALKSAATVTMWVCCHVRHEVGKIRERELKNKRFMMISGDVHGDGFFKDALEKGAKVVHHELHQDTRDPSSYHCGPLFATASDLGGTSRSRETTC